MAWLKWRHGIAYLGRTVGQREVYTSLRTSDRKEAKQKLRDWETAHEQKTGELTVTPLGEVIDAYLDHVRQTKSKATQGAVLWTLRDAFGEISPGLTNASKNAWAKQRSRDRARKAGKYFHVHAQTFEEIDAPHLSDWLRKMVKHRNWSPATATKRRNVLSALWTWALKTHGIRRPGGYNPVERVQTYKEQADEIRFLSFPQIQSQLDALAPPATKAEEKEFQTHDRLLRGQVQAMVATYIYAGLRLAEALHLAMEDVELGDGVNGYGLIRVRAKTWAGGRWQPKTGKNRVVPISSRLYPILRDYQRPPHFCTWYFPSPEGSLWSETNFGRKFRSLQAEAGMEWTCLDFRHTFGSHLAQSGVSPYKIAKLMGNSEGVVRKHYAALITEDMTSEVEITERPPMKRAVPG